MNSKPNKVQKKYQNIIFLMPYMPVVIILAISFYYGVPFFKDNNETFQSYNHGWNLLYRNSIKVSFLTDNRGFENFDFVGDAIYTHNPNFPRYIHALLLIIGINDIVLHVALISCLSFLLTVFFITRQFNYQLALAIVFFTILDWVGFQFFTNTYRTWSYPLFWGCIYAMRSKWTAFIAFFIAFQFEYGFATFIGITALLFHNRWYERYWALAGATLSLLLFAIQVVSYIGFDGFYSEVILTSDRRLWQGFFSWPSYYSKWLLVLIVGMLIIYRNNENRRLIASVVAGGITAFLLMRGYVLDAFISHGLPFITFIVVIIISTVVIRIRFFGVTLITFTLLYNSIENLKRFPPVQRGYIQAVREVDGPVTSSGPLFAIAFAIRPQSGKPTYELCLERPWFMISCGASYKVLPIIDK